MKPKNVLFCIPVILACQSPLSKAAAPMVGNQTILPGTSDAGDLSVSGDIDFGSTAGASPQAAVQLNYFSTEKSLIFDLTENLTKVQWRDNNGATARNKMRLDENNILSIYNTAGTSTGITLNPTSGQIILSGTSSGIFAGGSAIFSVGPSGNITFGDRTLSISSTTPSTSSASGALTVAGGLGVASDSWISGIRIGKGSNGDNASTAVGYDALKNNSTGFSNTAFGFSSLWSNTSGYNNTAFGIYTLSKNQTGTWNAAFGNGALGHNLDSANTAVGADALGFKQWGHNNVALGVGAGARLVNGSNLTTSIRNIYIGAGAAALSNSDTNSIVIGEGAKSEGTNTTVLGNSDTIKTHLFGQTLLDSLKVTNATILQGSVVIEQPQGDISMGIYQ